MRLITLLRKIFLLVLLVSAIFLHAQETDIDDDDEEDEEGINIETDWDRTLNLYTRGDQIFCINLGLVKSLFFVEQKEGYFSTQMNLGGMGSLGYNYFLGPHWFLGGELGGMFASTLGENMFYIIPIGVRGGYQFILGRFEFPLSFMIGLAPQSYNNLSYLGLFAKPAVGAYFRFNTQWSFGLQTGFWWVPQWTGKSRELDLRSSNINIHGFFWEASLGVRYHF